MKRFSKNELSLRDFGTISNNLIYVQLESQKEEAERVHSSRLLDIKMTRDVIQA